MMVRNRALVATLVFLRLALTYLPVGIVTPRSKEVDGNLNLGKLTSV
jgi:hypothetical protein